MNIKAIEALRVLSEQARKLERFESRCGQPGVAPSTDDWLQIQAINTVLEYVSHLELAKAKLEKELINCADILDEVRTGEDFECVCSNAAESARHAMGIPQ